MATLTTWDGVVFEIEPGNESKAYQNAAQHTLDNPQPVIPQPEPDPEPTPEPDPLKDVADEVLILKKKMDSVSTRIADVDGKGPVVAAADAVAVDIP